MSKTGANNGVVLGRTLKTTTEQQEGLDSVAVIAIQAILLEIISMNPTGPKIIPHWPDCGEDFSSARIRDDPRTRSRSTNADHCLFYPARRPRVITIKPLPEACDLAFP